MSESARFLAAYDEQLRTDAETPGAVSVKRHGPLHLAAFRDGRGFVTYRDLGDAGTEALRRLVRGAVDCFRADPGITRVEWKTRSHDHAPGLHEVLLGHGFVPDPPESIMIGGAQALMEYEPVRATVTAEPGGFRMGLGLYTFAVCNSRLIGGGRLIAPEAIIDDGLLDLCLIEAMSVVEFLNLARKVSDGAHVDDPRVRYVQASSIVIELDRETKINTDGEVLNATRCEYSVLPRAATFLAGDAPFAGH